MIGRACKLSLRAYSHQQTYEYTAEAIEEQNTHHDNKEAREIERSPLEEGAAAAV